MPLNKEIKQIDGFNKLFVFDDNYLIYIFFCKDLILLT